MAKNPMQRKSRNSFLLGMLVTVIVMGAVVGILVFKLISINNSSKTVKDAEQEVYVLSKDIKSGESIKIDNLKKVKVSSDVIPQNKISVMQIEDTTIAKIDLKQGTILASDMISTEGDKTTSDIRTQEYNMIMLPSQINTDEYVDIRLRLPSGLDYIVLSKKKIELPSVMGIDSENTILMKLNESEIQTMSNAIVENYIMTGSILYVSRYVEPGLQSSSIPTYVPSTQVQEAIRQNSNITVEARNALITRFNSSTEARNSLNSNLSVYSDKSKDNVEKSVEEEVNKAMQERKKYLDALSK